MININKLNFCKLSYYIFIIDTLIFIFYGILNFFNINILIINNLMNYILITYKNASIPIKLFIILSYPIYKLITFIGFFKYCNYKIKS